MTVKSHIKTKAWALEAGKSAGKNIDKRKTSDLEFRDMTNSWIQDTLENIKRRRNFDKHDPQNMVCFILVSLFLTLKRNISIYSDCWLLSIELYIPLEENHLRLMLILL